MKRPLKVVLDCFVSLLKKIKTKSEISFKTAFVYLQINQCLSLRWVCEKFIKEPVTNFIGEGRNQNHYRQHHRRQHHSASEKRSRSAEEECSLVTSTFFFTLFLLKIQINYFMSQSTNKFHCFKLPRRSVSSFQSAIHQNPLKKNKESQSIICATQKLKQQTWKTPVHRLTDSSAEP